MIRRLVSWFLAPRPLLGAALSMLLVASALGVVWSAHQVRNMYRDLQALEQEHDDLEHEFRRLLLERGVWADYTRLNLLAEDRLGMVPPGMTDTVVLQ